MPPPLEPFATTFGPVNSSLALGCAREVDYEQGLARLGRISELAWAPPLVDSQQHFRDLPPDQLVFISTLLEILVLAPIFQPFFESAVMSFVHDWVEYQEGLSPLHPPTASPVGSSLAPENTSGLQRLQTE
ncbi:hypothetical protein B0H10DRAFT_2198486 [Mycena sp. CBHHK59/15]|nr:hypothetical protein B0H10DRAFT_2198486 [Mycena sp. CBHHK59/15]